jgi:hypothetical protein
VEFFCEKLDFWDAKPDFCSEILHEFGGKIYEAGEDGNNLVTVSLIFLVMIAKL